MFTCMLNMVYPSNAGTNSVVPFAIHLDINIREIKFVKQQPSSDTPKCLSLSHMSDTLITYILLYSDYLKKNLLSLVTKLFRLDMWVCHLSLLQVKMKRPVLLGSQVEIVRAGQFYTLLLGKHISLSWDKGTHLLVHISATYRVLIHQNNTFPLVETFFFFSFILYFILNMSLFVTHIYVFRAGCVVCVVTLTEMSTTTWWAVTTSWRWTSPTLGIPGRLFQAVPM